METHDEVEVGSYGVQLYAHDNDLVDTVSAYLYDGLRGDEVVIVVATQVHMAAFETALRALGADLDAYVARRALVRLDVARVLSEVMGTQGPDVNAFDDVIGSVVRQAVASGRRVRAYGELVTELWDAGQVNSAIHVESWWNDLGLIGHLDIAPKRAFEKSVQAPRDARRFVAEKLEQWGRRDLIDDASLVVSELATNAVLHARSDFTVALVLSDGGVHIEVSDSSSAQPILNTTSATAASGRGVALVAAVSNRWGSDVTLAGKNVWAVVR